MDQSGCELALIVTLRPLFAGLYFSHHGLVSAMLMHTSPPPQLLIAIGLRSDTRHGCRACIDVDIEAT